MTTATGPQARCELLTPALLCTAFSLSLSLSDSLSFHLYEVDRFYSIQ